MNCVLSEICVGLHLLLDGLLVAESEMCDGRRCDEGECCDWQLMMEKIRALSKIEYLNYRYNIILLKSIITIFQRYL